MSAPSVVALALVALMIGCSAGSMYQTWTAHYRNMEAMTGRYLAEKAWLSARTTEILAEVERDASEVKADLKKHSKGGQKHGK
jgi:hypothetical protein